MVENWPVVFSGYEFSTLFDAKMPCLWIVIVPINKFGPDNL